MKKSIYLLASLFLSVVTYPVFAQAEPGNDPVAAPIDDSIWVLVLIAIAYAFIKFRARYKCTNSSVQ